MSATEPEEVGGTTGLIHALGEVRQEIANLTEEAKSQRAFGRRNRVLIRLLSFSLAFDMALSVALGIIGVQARDASRKATSASSATIVNCRAANVSRQVQTDLWDYAFKLTSNTPQTPDQAKATAQFKDYLVKAFAQRDCSTLTP